MLLSHDTETRPSCPPSTFIHVEFSAMTVFLPLSHTGDPPGDPFSAKIQTMIYMPLW